MKIGIITSFHSYDKHRKVQWDECFFFLEHDKKNELQALALVWICFCDHFKQP